MYDVIVIGGGPGGYAAGIRASQMGGSVAIVEAAQMGGTCVNWGCIPSKVWLRAAALKQAIEKSDELGIDASVGGIDFGTIVERKNGVSGDIQMGMGGLCSSYGIEVVTGTGALKSPREVDVDGNALEAKSIIIATGSSIAVPDIAGINGAAITTDEVFNMTEIPGSILINGAGHIEVEIASLLAAFGSKVHLVAPRGRVLPKEDGDTSQRVGQVLREQGIEILSRYTLDSLQQADGGYAASLKGSEDLSVTVERVLVSSREPNTGNLGLETVGVELTDEGFIAVNDNLATSVDGVFALGDVAGGWMLSHAATYMGVAAAENAMGEDSPFPSRLVPRALFCAPEVGAVGLSEEDAEEEGIEVETGDFPYAINGAAMAYGDLEGAVKIVADAEFGEILGVHIVGARATELIGTAVLAMQLETTADDLARTIMVHPTFSESIPLAAQDVASSCIYLPKR